MSKKRPLSLKISIPDLTKKLPEKRPSSDGDYSALKKGLKAMGGLQVARAAAVAVAWDGLSPATKLWINENIDREQYAEAGRDFAKGIETGVMKSSIAQQSGLSQLLSLHDDLTAVLPIFGSRQLEDGPTIEELALEREFGAELELLLMLLYFLPLERGLLDGSVNLSSRREIEAFVLEQFGEQELYNLRNSLERYGRRAANIGGNLALEQLGEERGFSLRNAAMIAAISAFIGNKLLAKRGKLSLLRTTARDLSALISVRADLPTGELQRIVSSFVLRRARERGSMIAEGESIRWSRKGLLWVYGRNAVKWCTFHTQRDDRVCPICRPYDGRRLRVSDLLRRVAGLIPLHPRCRCYYEPDLEGWERPIIIWRGEDD